MAPARGCQEGNRAWHPPPALGIRPRTIAGPADIKRLNVDEAKPIEIEPVDSPHRIVLSHVLVKTRY
jgi:hypothetical protein